MDKLTQKVRLYISRMKKDSLVEKHRLDEEGYWRVISGALGDEGYREPLKDILNGKFVDAVAYAVQQKDFYGSWMNHEDPSNRNNGHVEKVKIVDLKDNDLAKLIFDSYKTD